MQIQTGIKVASCSLNDLFMNQLEDKYINGELRIPLCQRPYIWGHLEVEKLINDIKIHFQLSDNTTPDYYLGSIILHQENGCLNIIDGQQRLTTMGILFNLLGQKVDIPYSSPVSLQVIKQNTSYIKETIEIFKDIKNQIFSNINVTLVVTTNEDEAYNFFETQNTGGVRLRGVDIIKAYHLRAIEREKDRGKNAIIWEKQKAVDHVVKMLLKTRSWNWLFWMDVPGRMDTVGMKKAIIEEFSERAKCNENINRSYQLVEIVNNDNGFTIGLPDCLHHIRQPIIAGENFIAYLQSFCGLYESTFLDKNAALIDKELIDFFNDVIFIEDGTTFLKWLFEICIICYAHRFGAKNLLEAAYWIFRATYSMRLSHEKNVREDSIPKFVRDEQIIEYILGSFTYDDCIRLIKDFIYEVNDKNTDGNTVKSRFIERVSSYFSFTNSHLQFDDNLKNAIILKLQHAQV